MNKPIPTPQSSTAAKVDVYSVVRMLRAAGVHLDCPIKYQDKIVEVHVSVFDGLSIKPFEKI